MWGRDYRRLQSDLDLRIDRAHLHSWATNGFPRETLDVTDWRHRRITVEELAGPCSGKDDVGLKENHDVFREVLPRVPRISILPGHRVLGLRFTTTPFGRQAGQDALAT